MNFNAIFKNVKIIKIGPIDPKIWKNHKCCQKSLKTNLSKKYNSLKDNEYSLNGFSVTENSFRIFESTNHRRGRENSNIKIGPTLD